jgi:RecA-family ATPase
MSAIRNGSWLDEQVFADPTWVVPGVLPEGCCVLTGHPKFGKSFLVLAIALAAASGGGVLGMRFPPKSGQGVMRLVRPR